MGIGSSWGAREEFLHPRDSHGRFRNSWRMPAGVISQISDFLSKFSPMTFGSDGQAGQYAFNLASKKPGRFAGGEDLHRLRLDMGHANHSLRLGKTDPSTDKFVDMMEREKISAPEDMILSRVTSPEAFGLHADTADQIEELTGKLIADRGYGAARLGTPLSESVPGQPRVLMTIATPRGTPIVVPGEGRDDRRVFLDKGQGLRITKVKSDGQGGYYVMAVAEPKSGHTPEPMQRLAPSATSPSRREAQIVHAQKTGLGRPSAPEQQGPSLAEVSSKRRQTEIDSAKTTAESAGRVHEMIGNGEKRPEVLRRTIEAQVKQHNLPPEIADNWAKAADNPQELSKLLDSAEKDAGLTRVGTPGDVVKFDRTIHQSISEGSKNGEAVEVVRPGYFFKSPNGEDVRISRAIVDPTDAPLPTKPEVKAADVTKMTIPQLRAHAKEKGIKIPSSITRKADIVSHIQSGGKIPEKVAPTDVTKMTIPQLRTHAKEKGIRIPSSITRKADIVSHIQGGGKVAEKAAPQISTSGPLPENLTIAQLRQAAKERGIKIPSSVTRKADIRAYIEEGKAAPPAKKATATRVTTDETGKILSIKNLKTPESKAPIKRMVGESVTDPNTARIVPVPGRSKGDEKIVLPNDGFDQGAMHLDSNLGKLWVDLYHDQRSPNSFVNRVEKIGEDLGFGKASSAQTIDRLKALKTDAPDSVVADRIQKVIDAIDYPSKPLPKIPEGTPPVLADLIKKFNNIPLARRPGRGGMSDVDHAVQLAEKAGKLTRGQLATEMRKLRSFHHESEDGWAEMQRALAKAIEGVLKR